MDKEFLASSVMTASPIQLVIITYDILFENIKDAISCFESKDYSGYDDSIDNAKAALRELMEALNMDYDISVDLMALYLQTQKLLFSAKSGRKVEKLKIAQKIMIPLYEGWKQIAQQEKKDDSARSSVVAGMTYGRNDINVSGNFGNEFKA